MTANGAVETTEIERKYSVEATTQLPNERDFAELGFTVTSASDVQMIAQYFDTANGDLAQQRVALRKRSGGKDAGWHLKFTHEFGARELLWPLTEDMPDGLLAEIVSMIGETRIQDVQNIAVLHTTRKLIRIARTVGEPLIEIADDLVDATNTLTGNQKHWREWEAELLDNTNTTLLDTLEPLLIRAGAQRVRGTSKIQRTMQVDH